MATTSLPQSATHHSPDQKADQLVSKFLKKTVLVIADARLGSDSLNSSDDLEAVVGSDAGTLPGLESGSPDLSNPDALDFPPGHPAAVVESSTLSAPASPTQAVSSKPAQSNLKLNRWVRPLRECAHFCRLITLSSSISRSPILILVLLKTCSPSSTPYRRHIPFRVPHLAPLPNPLLSSYRSFFPFRNFLWRKHSSFITLPIIL